MDKKIVKECEKYIREHLYYIKAPLEAIAQALGYNSSYVSRTFKRATGIKLMDYYRNKIMERATELLETGMNVIDAN